MDYRKSIPTVGKIFFLWEKSSRFASVKPLKTTVYLGFYCLKEIIFQRSIMTKNCKHCGTILHGKYCFSCGQKIITPEDKKLKHLLTEFFHHFTHLDGKYLVTLKRILFYPGKVTREISEGITVPHFKLTALFLVGTIIYYLLPTNAVVATTANASFKKHIQEAEYHVSKNQYAIKKSQAKNISIEALELRFDKRQHDYGKLLILLFLPLLIPVLWVFSKLIKIFNPDNSFTAYDLGVASLEINSIILYGFYLLAGIIVWIATSITQSETVALVAILIFTPALFFQLFSFFRRAYDLKWWQALICLTLLIFAFIYVMQLYGWIAFLIFI